MTLDEHLAEAQRHEELGDVAVAARHYVDMIRVAFGHTQAVVALQRIAKHLFADAIAVRDKGDVEAAIGLLVRSIELDPRSGESRAELKRLRDLAPERDLTAECLIFPDSARAAQIYGGAIQTAIDFCVYGGITGDVMEFGVLAGWTSRIFAERMRDTQHYGDLRLFDSFEGLPRVKWPIDEASYDVSRGIWQEEMEVPKKMVAEIDAPIDEHIKKMLSRIISPDRIHIRSGLFSQSLREPLKGKAAIVHFDCDLYQSTMEVFDALDRDEVLQDGTVLMFDDWNCNRANPAFGQRRALREFLDRGQDRYEVSSYFNYGFNSAAFILHDCSGVPQEFRLKRGPLPMPGPL